MMACLSMVKFKHLVLQILIFCQTFQAMMANQLTNQVICNASLSMRNLTGEVIMAGLFPLNYYSTKKAGFVRNIVAITWVEAFLFAIRSINETPDILPNITIGYDIRNSCNEEDIALRNVLDFRLDKNLQEQRGQRRIQQIGFENQGCFCGGGRNRIMAVVGGASSSISTSVSHVLGVDNLPQISYSSTSQALSNKEKYPNFLRTIPPDNYQAKAIAGMLRYFGWNYVSVLASDDDYGRLGYFGLDRELKSRGMCVSEVKIFKRKLPSAQLGEIIELLRRGQGKKANVVVLWCQINEAKIILEEAWKRGLRNLTWIGCETLGSNTDLFELGEIVNGFLGVKPTLSKVPQFEDYLKTLSPENQTHKNPWLELYWDTLPSCPTIKSNESAPQNLTIPCGAPKTGRNLPRSKYSHVISAVYAISLGLNSSNQLKNLSSVTPSDLLKEIKKVKFTDAESNIKISFDEVGDPNFASYTFTNIQRVKDGLSFHFVDIGVWKGGTGELNISKELIVFPNNQTSVSSICSELCAPGTYKIPGSIPCCWTCMPCKENSASTSSNASMCTACPTNSISNVNRTACQALTEIFFSTYEAIFIAILSTSFLAIVCVLFVVYLFIKHWNTPVVKSSNRELSILQLFSLMFSLWYPSFYWLKPSPLYCHVKAIWLSLFTAIAIAIVLVKTYRLLRIFSKQTTSGSKILENRYQALFVFGFVLVQVIIAALWLSYNELVVVKTVNRRELTFFRHCCKQSGTLLVILQSYILLMSLASAFMAFRARHLPDAFNEARYISFATFVYCVTWICAIPLYASLGIIARLQVVCAMNTIGNLALLICLYANKIRVLLFMPEQNTRHFFTRQATENRFKRTATYSASVSALPSIGLDGTFFHNSSASNSPQTKHLSMISSGSFTLHASRFQGERKKILSPRDILNDKLGRQRSQTFD